jgi:hypothetical protein
MARVIDRTENPLQVGVNPVGRGGLDLCYLLTITDRSHGDDMRSTKMLKCLLRLGFVRGQCPPYLWLWNKSSQRVLEKVGMKSVAYIPHAFQKRGHWIEANKTNITKQQWLALHQRL